MKSLGDRMKENYENRYRIKLTRRMPVVLRLDGKAFHTLTRSCQRPFDESFSKSTMETAVYLCSNIQGAKCAYVQSDEISILLTDFDRLETDAWFDYNLQKMVSVASGMASSYFSLHWIKPSLKDHTSCIFDCRVFNIPKEEVCNYFIWRQQDWQRNSISMLAQAYFSHKELHKKSTKDMLDMLMEKNVNWNELDDKWKNGICILRDNIGWAVHSNIIFTDNRLVIENYLEEKI